MTIPHAPLTLLIDGNNLAHFLYTNLAPGIKMSPADSRRLIHHLNAYARTYSDQLIVDLCLDRSPGMFDLPVDNMLVSFAEYPQTGDDLLLGRFWFYHLDHQPCLVITNDEAILEEISEAGGASLRVYDFVRRPGLVSPVFRAPDELPALVPLPGDTEKHVPVIHLSTSIYFRIVEEDRARRTGSSPTPDSAPPSEQMQTRPSEPAQSDNPPPAAPARPQAEEAALCGAKEKFTAAYAPEEAEPYYFLSFDTWPVAEGVRFLLNAFCPEHRAQHRDLMEAFTPGSLRPADLRALAELLLHTCGSEPNFARRGALMTRVRLALLQARGDPLALSELAERTGLKVSGLRGRIRQKADPWVEIIY